MYVNEYTNIDKALELLKSYGSLSLGDAYSSPSFNEETAYNTILLSKDPAVIDSFFLHRPSRKIMLKPKVGMGVTLQYPSDRYPYEIIKVVSEQTLEIRAMEWAAVPGWKPDFTPGGFCGHIHNLHEQKFTYSSNPNGKTLRIRLNKKGRWMNQTIPFHVGEARFFIDRND